MNLRPKSFTISLPPRAFYSNGRTTYRLPDSPGHKFAYLDGHLFKLLVDVLVITQHADGVTIFGAVQVEVIGQRSKANIMQHNAHLRTLPKRPSGQPDSFRSGHAAAQDGMADNPLAQGIFHGAESQARWATSSRVVEYFAAFGIGGPILALFSVQIAASILADTAILALYSRYRNPQAFDAAFVVLRDFMLGSKHRYRTYGQESVDTQSLMQSRGIQQLLDSIHQRCSEPASRAGEGLDSWQALRNIPYDLAYSPAGGQVGGDLVEWHRADGQIYFHVSNDAGARSFFFHAVPNVPDGFAAPFNTIHQDYYFHEPDPCQRR